MPARVTRHLRTNAIAYLALFVALGGTAYAAATIGAKDIKADAVRQKHIKAGAVHTEEILDDTVSGIDIADGSIGGSDISETSLQGLLGTEVQSGLYADATEDPLAELNGAALEIHDDGNADAVKEVVVEHTGLGGVYHVLRDDQTVVNVAPSSSVTIAADDNVLDLVVHASGFGGAKQEAISVSCAFDQTYDEGAADTPAVVCFSMKPLGR